nr:MAG TPA: zinc-ribbon containing domain protein [Caudoviricetes sp.]
MQYFARQSRNSINGGRMVARLNVSANRINTNWFGIIWILRKLFWNARNVVKENKYSLITIPLRRNLIWRINMKPEEALKELSYDDTAYGGNCTYEVRMEAIKALEKQIPMKPNNIKSIFDFSGRYYTTKGNCPVCNREGLYKSDFYCNRCGQKLDWGDANGK